MSHTEAVKASRERSKSVVEIVTNKSNLIRNKTFMNKQTRTLYYSSTLLSKRFQSTILRTHVLLVQTFCDTRVLPELYSNYDLQSRMLKEKICIPINTPFKSVFQVPCLTNGLQSTPNGS